MTPEHVEARIGPAPDITAEDGWILYELIARHRLRSVLEIGFVHGGSTVHMAGAVDDIGGALTSIGLLSEKERTPNVEELLEQCGLLHRATLLYEPKTPNWRLMKLLDQTPVPQFNLIYIGGPRTWVDCGFSFCLAKQLLRSGGWIVLQGIGYTLRNSQSRDKEWARKLPEDEQTTAQVERVFSLLAMGDPEFHGFRVIGRHAFAQKRPEDMPGNPEALYVETQVAAAVRRALRDTAWRYRLLTEPARALSEISGEDTRRFRHVRFIEGSYACPSEPEVSENGLVTHLLERPVRA